MNSPVYERLKEIAPSALEGSSVVFAYLFGSHATGGNQPYSDVDIAVYLDPTVDPNAYLDASLGLARRLQVSGVGGIEVLILNNAPLPVRGRATQQRRILYSRDEPARVRFESETLREFFDFEIHARPLAEKFLRDTAEGRR